MQFIQDNGEPLEVPIREWLEVKLRRKLFDHEINLLKLIEKADKEGGEVKLVKTKTGHRYAIVKTD